MTTLNFIGAAITLGLGLMGLVWPMAAARLTGLKPEGKLGMSELRATYGGFFLVLGAYCLVTQEEVAFTLVGLAWLGAAAARLISIFVDRNREAKNLGGVLFEGIIGALLIL